MDSIVQVGTSRKRVKALLGILRYITESFCIHNGESEVSHWIFLSQTIFVDTVRLVSCKTAADKLGEPFMSPMLFTFKIIVGHAFARGYTYTRPIQNVLNLNCTQAL